MKIWLRCVCFALMLGSTVITLDAKTARSSVKEYPAPLVRERQIVIFGHVREIWELRWEHPPTPACEPGDVSLTCPCTGFAYGEGGKLALVRIRDNREIDRLDLTSFFAGADVNLGGVAILQRWEPDYKTDFEDSQKDDFQELVARRPVVKIMNFVDYDHDGMKSEFYLQTDTAPCGKNLGVVIGVSRSNPKLHVFGTTANPDEPLVLQKHIWDALSRASASVDVVDWPCGDHGSEEETTNQLRWTPKGIDGTRRWFDCPRVLEQRPLGEGPL
jgi:hypothetical protein